MFSFCCIRIAAPLNFHLPFRAIWLHCKQAVYKSFRNIQKVKQNSSSLSKLIYFSCSYCTLHFCTFICPSVPALLHHDKCVLISKHTLYNCSFAMFVCKCVIFCIKFRSPETYFLTTHTQKNSLSGVLVQRSAIITWQGGLASRSGCLWLSLCMITDWKEKYCTVALELGTFKSLVS